MNSAHDVSCSPWMSPLPAGARVLSLAGAVEVLRAGGLVAYPTETFFGLGCLACRASAVARVYQVKRRDVHLPLPVIIADAGQLPTVACPDAALLAALTPLMQRFWPGPLTLLLPAQAQVPPLLSGGTGRIALRVSSHPVAHALSAALGEALVSSSANISGRPAARTAQELDPALFAPLLGQPGVAGLVMEGPLPAGGAPSTLVEWVPEPEGGGHLHLLREGAVSAGALTAAGYRVCIDTRSGIS